MLILGIDPGYAIVGYGVLDYKNNHFDVVDYGAITTDAGVLEIQFVLTDKLCGCGLSVHAVYSRCQIYDIFSFSELVCHGRCSAYCIRIYALAGQTERCGLRSCGKETDPGHDKEDSES